MTSFGDNTSARRLMICALVYLAFSCPVLAQDLPTDTQIQQAFGTGYNHLGRME